MQRHLDFFYFLGSTCTYLAVWDAEVRSEKSGKTIALFRCTQMILR